MTAVMPGPPVSRSGRVAAVDWSGRAVGSERFIWIAIAEEGLLASLECGRDRGALRGFAVLARLRREGFRIWPFDDPGTPMAVEIFPRLLTGPVVKSRAAERDRYLRLRGWPLAGAVSEDAFDAEVSALVMDRHR